MHLDNRQVFACLPCLCSPGKPGQDHSWQTREGEAGKASTCSGMAHPVRRACLSLSSLEQTCINRRCVSRWANTSRNVIWYLSILLRHYSSIVGAAVELSRGPSRRSFWSGYISMVPADQSGSVTSSQRGSRCSHAATPHHWNCCGNRVASSRVSVAGELPLTPRLLVSSSRPEPGCGAA